MRLVGFIGASHQFLYAGKEQYRICVRIPRVMPQDNVLEAHRAPKNLRIAIHLGPDYRVF